nr:MAG TPA: hypothetical protein [Caudoviricetes sp.]
MLLRRLLISETGLMNLCRSHMLEIELKKLMLSTARIILKSMIVC